MNHDPDCPYLLDADDTCECSDHEATEGTMMKAYEHSSGGKWFAAADGWNGVPREPRREDCYDTPEAAVDAHAAHVAWLIEQGA